MLILLAARSASAWCSFDFLVDYTTGNWLAWPGYGPAPSDTMLVLTRYGVGDIGEIVVRDPEGVEVPVTRHDLTSLDGVDWAVLVPLAPLAPGEGYAVESVGTGPQRFDVGEAAAEVGTPPTPVTRSIQSEVTWADLRCPTEAVTASVLDYRLCNAPALTLVALGDTEPPAPTLSDPGEVVVGWGDTVRLAEGLAPGLTTTVWLGGFDGAGRFTGWTPDLLEMPPVGTMSSERADGAEGGAGTTPTAFSGCPDSGVWTLESTQTCESWSHETNSCLVADVAPESNSSGCDTGTGPASVFVSAALLLVTRGRRRR